MPDRQEFETWAKSHRLSSSMRELVWKIGITGDFPNGETWDDILTLARRKRHNENRSTREGVLRDCGLVKVRGALGGTYWE